ncbi:MAG TPA: hypothetical protein VHQ20_00060 [Patescibacteria group bacterium]|jgi:hypothetical protein|nr:hypothetical protein [Patescibacteria group bacterium]
MLIDGYISPKDAEKIRKIRLYADEILAEREQKTGPPPTIVKGVMTLAESKSHKRPNKEDHWPEGVDEKGREIFFDSNVVEEKNAKKIKRKKFDPLMTSKVRLYYNPSKKAIAPHLIDTEDFHANDYKFRRKYLLLIYSLSYFLDDEDD